MATLSPRAWAMPWASAVKRSTAASRSSSVTERRGERHAVGVGAGQRGALEHPGAGRGRRHGRGKARAFLVAEGQHVDAEGKLGLGAGEGLRGENAGDDAERAVVLAGVDHG